MIRLGAYKNIVKSCPRADIRRKINNKNLMSDVEDNTYTKVIVRCRWTLAVINQIVRLYD
jgi:hypothetical protein